MIAKVVQIQNRGPRVIQVGTDLDRVINDAIDSLAYDEDTYSRDGALVHVVRTSEPDGREGAVFAAGAPQLRKMSVATLRERLAKVAGWEKPVGAKGAWVSTVPSDHIIKGVADRGEWKGIRPIVGMIEAPALRPDGSVLQEPGYDRTTGYLYVPSVTFPKIADEPSKDDAARALAELEDVFQEFPYAAPAHRSAVIASLLTLIARPAIRGAVPAFLFDASTRGSGKTLQADAVAIIATGRMTAKMSHPADEAELEKVLAAYALRGAQVVNFDNITRPFGGGPLDRCLTAGDTVELRVLGRSEIPSLKWRATIFATGNNITLTGDTARRVLMPRLESELEDPEARANFAHWPLREWVQENRARLVVAALTVLRAYVVAGLPTQGVGPWGSFEAWTALVPSAIVFAGGADPLGARPASDGQEDTEKRSLQVILDGIKSLDGDSTGMTTKTIVGLLYPADRLRQENGPPDGYDDLREAIESLVPTAPGKPPNTTKLSGVLRRFKGRVIGGKKLVVLPHRGGVSKWTVRDTIATGHGGGDGGVSWDFPNPSREEKMGCRAGVGKSPPTPPTQPDDLGLRGQPATSPSVGHAPAREADAVPPAVAVPVADDDLERAAIRWEARP